MTSNLDYKKYSLEKLQEWVHDALSCGEASPHEIYSVIREAAQEDYQYYKDHAARAFGLLELMSGHRPVADDDELHKAALAEREYYEGAKNDGMTPWGHSDIEYQIANHKKSLTCDKDDPSPECQKSWNDFWEEHYYPEEYKGSTVSSVQKDEDIIPFQNREDLDPVNHLKHKRKRWVLPVEEIRDEDTDKDEYCVTFPDDLLEAANLKEGDVIEWVDQGDGSYLLKKGEKPMSYDEAVAAGWTMTDDGIWWPPQNY